MPSECVVSEDTVRCQVNVSSVKTQSSECVVTEDTVGCQVNVSSVRTQSGGK